MPKETKVRKNTRSQHSAQDTFRWTTPDLMVASRPVDAYARPAMSNTAEAIHKSLKTFTGAGEKWGTIYEDQKDEWMEEGKQMRAAGIALPEDVNPNVAAGHRMMDGYLASDLIGKDMMDQFDEWKDLDPAAFRQQAEMFLNQAVAGKDEYYLKGLTSEVPRMLAGLQQSHQKYRIGKAQEKGRTHVRGWFAKEVNKMKADPQMADTATRAAHVRGLITQAQEFGSKGGYFLSKSDTTKAIIEAVKPMVEDTGEVELLAPFFVRDQEGVRIVDTDAGQTIPDIYEAGVKKREELLVSNAWETIMANHTAADGKLDAGEAYEATLDPQYAEALGVDHNQMDVLRKRLWAENIHQIALEDQAREKDRMAEVDQAFGFLFPEKGDPDMDSFTTSVLASKQLRNDEKWKLINNVTADFMGNTGPGFQSTLQAVLAGHIDESDIMMNIGDRYNYESAQQLRWVYSVLNPKGRGGSSAGNPLFKGDYFKDALKRLDAELAQSNFSRGEFALGAAALQRAVLQLRTHREEFKDLSDGEYARRFLYEGSKETILVDLIQGNKVSMADELKAKAAAARSLSSAARARDGYPSYDTPPNQVFEDPVDFVRAFYHEMTGNELDKTTAEKWLLDPEQAPYITKYYQTGVMPPRS